HDPIVQQLRSHPHHTPELGDRPFAPCDLRYRPTGRRQWPVARDAGVTRAAARWSPTGRTSGHEEEDPHDSSSTAREAAIAPRAGDASAGGRFNDGYSPCASPLLV